MSYTLCEVRIGAEMARSWRNCLEGKSDLKWEGIAIRLRLAEVKVWHVCGARM